MNDLSFVDANSSQIITEMITEFEKATGETLYPGDERRTFLLQLAPAILALKNDINHSAKQNLLRYAEGSKLEAIGELYGVTRLEAQKASVTLRFTLSGAQSAAVTIPAGTRVTPDGSVYFATKSILTIAAGQTQGDVIAESVEAGVIYNGYVAGQIKNIVDPVPYVASVINIDESSGGADVESDASYKERIRQAPESFSVAGSEGAYIFWAKTADSNISDVSVSSPSPGVIQIVPLMKGGTIPTQIVLDKVLAIVSAKDKRPLTDNVQVVAPSETLYNIDLTYYINCSRQTEEATIRNLIESQGGVIDQYVAWQREELGRAINPDELRFRMMNAGAYRVAVTSPSYNPINYNMIAAVGTVNVVYGGLE